MCKSFRKSVEVFQPSYRPRINKQSREIKRNVPIGDLLNEDAKRRSLSKSLSQSIKIENPKQALITQESQAVLLKRLVKEIDAVIKVVNLLSKQEIDELMLQKGAQNK